MFSRWSQEDPLVQIMNEIMASHQLSQSSLARLCGLPKTTLSDCLLGKRPATVELVGKLLSIFPSYTTKIVYAIAGLGYSAQISIVENDHLDRVAEHDPLTLLQ